MAIDDWESPMISLGESLFFNTAEKFDIAATDPYITESFNLTQEK
jgi:hypothetical protein